MDNQRIVRKKNTGETGNPGEFGKTRHNKPDDIPVASSRMKGPRLVESQRQWRGHNFYPPQRDWARIPGLYETEDIPAHQKTAHLHYFAGGSSNWWITEVDHDTGEAFGWCDPTGAGYPDAEWGYVSLPELEKVNYGPFGRPIERDCYYQPGPVPGLPPVRDHDRQTTDLYLPIQPGGGE